MAAVFNVFFDFGGTENTPGTEQNVDALGPPTIRFKTADDATIDTNNPIQKPSAGTKYSYWKHMYLKCATAPSTKCDNIKFYTDGSGFGTGITLKVGDETPTKNSSPSSAGYDPATGTPGDTGDVMTGHTDVTASTDAFSFTSASPKSVSISETDSLINAIGETTDYLIFQAEVGTTATAGDKADETLVWRFDEI